MALDICPCVKLKTGVKLVALVDAVSTICVVTFVVFAVAGGYLVDEEAWKIATWMILLGAISAAQIWTAGFLYYGVDSTNPKCVSVWLYVTCIIVLLNTLLLVGSIVKRDRLLIAYTTGVTVYKYYAVVVVNTFKASVMCEERVVQYSASESHKKTTTTDANII